jgi:NAD(P)H-nitrite reductase large subunit
MITCLPISRKNGSYSIVPRIPGGDITPEQFDR